MKINAAAVQFAANVGNKESNRSKMQYWIRTIMEEHPNCNLIVFPELAVTGYDYGGYMKEMAEEMNGESFRFFSEEAKQYGIHLVYGNMEKNVNGERPYNTVWLIGPDGSLLHTYRKIHLTNLEEAYFEPGHSLAAVHTAIGSIGILICWDMAFPEAARSYALQDVDLLIAPAAWEKPYQDPYVKFSMARALDNTTPLITCNHVGTNCSLDFFGHSRIYDATGTELAYTDEEEGYVYAEIDSASTHKHRTEFYTMLHERRPNIYKL
jgi:predicted amidohydrolase